MESLTHRVAGTECTINIVRTPDEADRMVAALAKSRDLIALDTETTGLNIYGSGFRVRTVQFGTTDNAWVVDLDADRSHLEAIVRRFVDTHPNFVMHNAPFDVCALAQTGLADFESLLTKTYDTYILAHLLDSRAQGEGGAPGHGLKALAQIFVDSNATDGQKELQQVFRSLGRTKATGWSHPDLRLHEVYFRYGGLDVIYTARLLVALSAIIRSKQLSVLAHREHRVQHATTRMTHRGVLCDLDYTRRLHDRLLEEQEQYTAVAQSLGVDNINSVKQVRERLLDRGVPLTVKTASGQYAVGGEVLLPLAGLTPYWTEIEGAPRDQLAYAILRAKRAGKWLTSYVDTFTSMADANGRVHPSIKALAARTGRMSISSPPLQQLPAGDWTIRRCLVADPGHVFVSTDFAQVELRVIAANAGVTHMQSAITNQIDLHDNTANLIWGTGNWTKKQRGIGKNVAFAKVYGGGAAVIAKTAGIPLKLASEVVDSFGRAYPEIDKHARHLQRQAAARNWILVTPEYGRHLALSRDRSYAALNYETQSVARDLFADALLKAEAEDVTTVLPVHDELITQWPIEEAEHGAATMKRLMTTTYRGVPISADSDILWGGSWGSHPDYKIDPTQDYRPEEHTS